MLDSNHFSSLNISYIGGGSQQWAWKLMNDLALEPSLGGEVRLYDIDFNAAIKNETIGNIISNRPESVGKWNYRAVPTLEEALFNADFVVISILPGTLDDMESDVHGPEKYGIYQSVGDSTGPGGLMRALRTIPMYVEFAQSIKMYCPNAWVINYTNPMSLCVRTLYEVFPNIKAIGCCHEVFGTQNLLAKALNESMNVDEQIRREDIEINVLGINHFTWVDQASYKGTDLLPLYSDFVDKYYDTGYEDYPGQWEETVFNDASRVKFDLFKRYGLIAAAGDRHLSEFVPWYLTNPDTVKKWKFHLTPVELRKKHRDELYEKGNHLATGKNIPDIVPSGEEGVALIKALLGSGSLMTNINIPNYGQIQGLPRGAVVETNAVVSYNSVRPLYAGELPLDIKNLTIGHILNYEAILQAALQKNKKLALRAFINDSLLTSHLDQSIDLFEQMFRNTKHHFTNWST